MLSGTLYSSVIVEDLTLEIQERETISLTQPLRLKSSCKKQRQREKTHLCWDRAAN